ncbi:hypothetical protein I4U23_003386 [Adineta vaga]|nr:hypothetical protein I4U23_003386 [Adineta vaga]
MANCATEQLNTDTLNRSESNVSLQSNTTVTSRRSSITTLYSMKSNRRRQGIFVRLGMGIHTMVRRFTRANKSLSEMDIQILTTITNFTRDDIFQCLCPQADAERFARHIFRAFDLDRSGTVDFREFLIGLSITSTTSAPETKLEWIFQVFDIDGNGLLTREECLEVIDTIVRFTYCQQINGEEINMDELVRSAKRSMMRIFDNISNNRRDSLTMLQFVEGCQKDTFISELFATNYSSNRDTSNLGNTHTISKIDE